MAIGAGIQAGYTAAWRVFEDPEQQNLNSQQQNAQYNRIAEYHLLWAYYSNSMFERTSHQLGSWLTSNLSPQEQNIRFLHTWQAYKANYNLYRNIRMIYNPTRRLVDFYAGQIYPGVLSEDGLELPDSIPMAVPFSEDTDPALKDAIGQFWQWSNWQSKKSVHVRYGAALGNVLIEVVDDVAHGKVTAEIVWPGFIFDLELNSAGDVQAYTIDYQVRDDDGKPYQYRKEVDKTSFRYYKDGEPFDYDGNGAVIPNIYGFVPAVWIKHIDVGGDHGSPAIAGSFGKIDELNNLASHVHDQIHKVIGAPVVMWSQGAIQNLYATQKRGPTSDFDEPAKDQESVLMLKGPADGRIDSLAGALSLSDTLPYMKELTGEIENDHPELGFYRMLREMSQVTGPAASRIAGDVSSRVAETQAAYDDKNISLFRMAVAIGGMRANSHAWGPLNRQQQKFLPFNLTSYTRGDLDMTIMPRPLLTPTKLETSQEKLAMWTGVNMAVTAGAPLALVLADEGWTDEEIKELQTQVDAEQTKQLAVQKQQSDLQTQSQLKIMGEQQKQLPPGKTNPDGTPVQVGGNAQ